MTCNIPTASIATPANPDSEPFFFGTSTATTTWGIPLQDVNKSGMPWFKTPNSFPLKEFDDVDTLKKELEELKENVKDLVAKNQDLEADNAMLSKKLFESKKKNESLETQHAKKVAELSHTVLYAQNELNAVTEKQKAAEQLAKEAQTMCLRAEKKNNDLQKELSSVKKMFTESVQHVTLFQLENQRLKFENDDINRRVAELEERINDIKRQQEEEAAKLAAKEAAEEAEYEHVDEKRIDKCVITATTDDTDFAIVSKVEDLELNEKSSK